MILAVGTSKHAPQALIQIQLLGGEIEAGSLRLPGIDLLLKIDSLHKLSE